MRVSEVTCEKSGQDFALQPSPHSKAVLWEHVLVWYCPGVHGVRSTHREQCCALGCPAISQAPNPLRAVGTHVWFLAQVQAVTTCPYQKPKLEPLPASCCIPCTWDHGLRGEAVCVASDLRGTVWKGIFDCVFLQKTIFSFRAFQRWLGGIMRCSHGVFPKHGTSSWSLGVGRAQGCVAFL